jgi:hypothetical protein
MAQPVLNAVELKVGRRKATPEQDAWLAALAAANVPAFVWTHEDCRSLKFI